MPVSASAGAAAGEVGPKRAQEQHRARPAQAVFVQALARTAQCGFEVAVRAAAEGRDQICRQLRRRLRLQRGKRRQHRDRVAAVRVEQGLGGAHVQRTFAAGAMAAPQQGQIDFAASHVASEVACADHGAAILWKRRVLAVVEQQPTAVAEAVPDPHQHMRPMGFQGRTQCGACGLRQRREPFCARPRGQPRDCVVVGKEQRLVQRAALLVDHIGPGDLYPWCAFAVVALRP